jgi:small subunit ribosomal protein S1
MSNRKNTQFIDELNAELGAENEAEAEKPAEDKEDFAKLLGESLKGSSRKLSVGDRIKGKILVVGREDVFVSTGTQNDGVLAKLELLDEQGNCPFKKDDLIDVYVTLVRGNEIRLSRNPTDKNLAEDLEDAFDMMLPVQGRVVEVCKGGVRVNMKGKLAFCPISQLDSRRVETPEEYVGRSLEFKITQFSEGGRNIVVSRRKLLEEQNEESAGSFLEENVDGMIVEGKVARLEKFGAFVEVAAGLEGLVHISEIAWSRIGDPAEVLTVGQDVTVKILKRETVGGKVRIALSIKQASERPALSPSEAADPSAPAAPDPWSKFSIGQVLTGKVTRKELYGLFVQLEPGVVGLLHKSRALDRPEFHFDKLKVGDDVTVAIGELKRDERRISLDVPRDDNAEEWQAHQKKQETATSFGTLGDKLKAAMAKKK